MSLQLYAYEVGIAFQCPPNLLMWMERPCHPRVDTNEKVWKLTSHSSSTAMAHYWPEFGDWLRTQSGNRLCLTSALSYWSLYEWGCISYFLWWNIRQGRLTKAGVWFVLWIQRAGVYDGGGKQWRKAAEVALQLTACFTGRRQGGHTHRGQC